MVSLSNQARLLAAQAFNKKVLEEKARAKQAEIEAERQEELRKLTRRKEEQLAKARNAVEAQRIRDSIAQDLKSKSAQAKIKAINAEAERKKKKAFSRVAKGANIGVLTGFEAKKDSKGRTVGISTRESKTRKNTKKLLATEIARQQKIAREGTDLERFLANEKAISEGRVSQAELNRQIAERKKRGLSKTPAQKRAAQFFRDKELSDALDRRAVRKGGGKNRATFGALVSERARAQDLGSDPFADPLFNFGGRSKKEVIARGGTFGRRVGGESIDSQLNFIASAKQSSTSGRINFANQLLAGLESGGIFSGGGSQQQLLGLVSQKKLKTPKTFEQTLREGQGFFTTVAKPVTKPKITKAQRQGLVRARKAEDLEKAQKAREQIAGAKAGTRARQQARQDDLAFISQSLLSSNLARGAQIERENLLARPRISRGEVGFIPSARERARDDLGRSFAQQQISDFGLAPFLDDIRGTSSGQITQTTRTVQRQQAQDPTQLSLLDPRPSVPLTTKQKVAQKRAQEAERRAQAQAITDQNKALRQAGLEGFASPELIQSQALNITTPSGKRKRVVQPRETQTFGGVAPIGQALSVDLAENIGIGDQAGVDIFGARLGDEGRPNEQILGDIGREVTNVFEPEPTPKQTKQQRESGEVQALNLVPINIPSAQQVGGQLSGGLSAFFAIGGSDALDLLSSPLRQSNQPSGQQRDFVAEGAQDAFGSLFGNFDVDLSFNPAEAGRRTAEQVF